MVEQVDRADAFLSTAINYAIALAIGLFAGASLWLWSVSGDGVVLAAKLSGLPICF